MRIEVQAPGTFRIRLRDSAPFKEPLLNRYGILKQPTGPVQYTLRHIDDMVELDTGHSVLTVNVRNGSLMLRSASGTERTRTAEPPRLGPGGSDSELQFTLVEEEQLYGLGDVTRERLQKRGYAAKMRVTNISAYIPVPFVMSSRGWALLMNTTRAHTFDLGCTDSNRLIVAGPRGELDFYLFSGDGYADLLNRYTDVAGKPALLPIWAYGLTFVCHDMLSAREVVDDALRLRSEGIPCDTIGLAGGWMERPYDHSTEIAWHPERFYSPKSVRNGPHTFVGTLQSHGFKLCLLLYCDYDLSEHEERMLWEDRPEPGLDDGKVPEPWYRHLRPFVDQGVSSFKLIGSRQLQNHPDREWANGTTDEDMHNLYHVLLAKQMFEGFQSQTGQRPFIYTIAGFTGIQRYAATAAGTSHNDHGPLVSMLNNGMSGHVHTTCDMFIHTKEGIHFGFLQPWSQINNWAYFRHPVFLEESLRKLFKTYARLRYRLLPYIYSAAHVAARTGMPILRAMPLQFPDDPTCRDSLHQYMLGPSLLVVAYTDSVQLPAGRWIDYWTGKSYAGPKRFEYEPQEGAGGPLFVRGGAILPMWPELDYVGQEPVGHLALHLYPHGYSEYTMYEDDGETFGYMEGQVAATVIRCEETTGGVRVWIAPRSGTYAGIPARRSFELIVHGQDKPSVLTVNGIEEPEKSKRVKTGTQRGWLYNRMSRTLHLLVEAGGRSEAEIRVEALFPANSKVARASRKTKATVDGTITLIGEFEKKLDTALKAGRMADVSTALRHWWNSRTKLADADDGWRIHLLEGCMVLIRYATQNGWPVAEVFRDDYAAMFHLQSVAVKEKGLELLETLAGHLVRYVHRLSQPGVHPLIQEILHIVDREIAYPLSLNDIAERLDVHPSHLSRLFKREVGTPFSTYIWKHRMERGKWFLESGMKVYEAAAKTGFKDVSYFSRVFRKYWGIPPVELRR